MGSLVFGMVLFVVNMVLSVLRPVVSGVGQVVLVFNMVLFVVGMVLLVSRTGG